MGISIVTSIEACKEELESAETVLFVADQELYQLEKRGHLVSIVKVDGTIREPVHAHV